jgi:hypothetical protein
LLQVEATPESYDKESLNRRGQARGYTQWRLFSDADDSHSLKVHLDDIMPGMPEALYSLDDESLCQLDMTLNIGLITDKINVGLTLPAEVFSRLEPFIVRGIFSVDISYYRSCEDED